jgi:Flp pilus assembly protein CpaB
MASKHQERPVFEIVIVLAIVAMVAITGQVLLNYNNGGARAAITSSSPTGFVVSDDQATTQKAAFTDVGVTEVDVNPASPIMGDSIEIKMIIANEGTMEISTPFYVEAEILTNGGASMKLDTVVSQALKPGEKATAIINTILIAPEGPVRIIATADSTNKLDDKNMGNNKMSKTIIMTYK